MTELLNSHKFTTSKLYYQWALIAHHRNVVWSHGGIAIPAAGIFKGSSFIRGHPAVACIFSGILDNTCCHGNGADLFTAIHK